MVGYFTKHHLPYHIILTRDKYLYQTIYARNNCDLNISLCSLQWRDNPTTTKQNRRHDSNRKMGPRCKNKMSNISTRHSHTHKSWTFLEWTKILNIKWINVFDPSQSLRRKTMEYNKISHKVTNKINLIYMVFLSYQKRFPHWWSIILFPKGIHKGKYSVSQYHGYEGKDIIYW